MRLEKIKLSGFKSFVDPTTVQLPSNLVGIVGPNGCGKSNVIDAVRWVMGESSAKTLRGESMTDVIFNGSSARKPIGQASIELVFDNSDGTIGGEYAGYSQISIRRLVNRESQSSYFLNGVRCRRRDIKDVFLGTGLGPRSYSIIEQGMISRFIEAKPDDLRIFIEEAAGISKYKERRRETENRIKHTRENVARVTDIRDELDKQLKHLQRQAQAAEKFTEYKAEERLLKAQLQAIRYRDMEANSADSQIKLRELETGFAEKQAKQQRVNTELEHQRERHIDSTDEVNEVQKRYYTIGQEVTRLEQTILHEKEKRTQLTKDYEKTDQQWQDTQNNLQQDREKIDALKAEIERLTPQLEEAKALLETSGCALSDAESAMQTWQASWDAFNQKAHEDTQTAEVSQAKIQYLEQQMKQCEQKIERIDEELGRLDVTSIEEQVLALRSQVETAETTYEATEAALLTTTHAIETRRDENHRLLAQLDDTKQTLQTANAKKASLETLQKAALGQSDDTVSEWLLQKQLHDAPRLVQQLDVEAGFEKAVETVLGDYLEAVCVDGLSDIAGALHGLDKGRLTFVDTSKAHDSVFSETLLLNKIKSTHNVGSLLQGVHFAETLEGALILRERLGGGESVVTREGIWLGANWLRVSHESSDQSGVIAREKALQALCQTITEYEHKLDACQKAYDDAENKLLELEKQKDSQQEDRKLASDKVADVNALLKVKQARLEQIELRLSQLTREKEEQQALIVSSKDDMYECRETWNTAMEAVEQHSMKREGLQRERETYQAALRGAKQLAHEKRDVAHGYELDLQARQSQLPSIEQGLHRLTIQLEDLSARREQLTVALEKERNPIAALEADLQKILQEHLAAEEALTSSRQKLNLIEEAMQRLEESRTETSELIDQNRSELEALRLDLQTMTVRKQTILEQLAETNLSLDEVNKELPEDAAANIWEEELEKMARRIQRLGAINLAAIEEFDAQSERKVYLDEQLADLEEALQTLETAINKIDQETKERFQETYNTINESFKALFPKVFGGGAAYLELTGDDLLSTGITVMAQPPGKRNSTIHLLSGGEKALTAIALVFSIFQLNPSPFCILDEVDAPLDDANVGRFCRLVEDMSEKVQFIYISHNKLAIAMAKQLIGVTMHEPGVSRLVAVDIEEAVAMAELA